MSSPKKVCMQCRAVRGGTRCSTCGDALLDLSSEVDRSIVRMAIDAPAGAEIIAFLAALVVGVAGLIAVGSRDRSFIGIIIHGLGLATLVTAIALTRARRRRAFGLAASDLRSAEERAADRRGLVEWLTGVPLWTAVVVVSVHAARASSYVVEESLAPLALRLGDLREGVIGPSLLGHGLLHSGVAHLVLNVVGLLLFGHALRMRVRNAGALLLLIGGIAGGAALQSLLHPDPDTTMVGISGGVYAWLAAPAALDPTLRTVFVLRGIAIPMPMWLRVALTLVLYTGVDAAVSAGSIAVFAHLGGGVAGLLLAFPLRRVQPTRSYSRWRAAHERSADST